MITFIRIVIKTLVITLLLQLCYSQQHQQQQQRQQQQDFPHRIKKLHVRKDIDTGHEVETGKLEDLGGISNFVRWGIARQNEDYKYKLDLNESKKVSYDKFKRLLQCSPTGDIIDHHGTLSLINNLHPLRKEFIENAAAFAENWKKCMQTHDPDFTGSFIRVDWLECTRFTQQLLKGQINMTELTSSNPNVRLIRIINGKPYFDWPWQHSIISNNIQSNVEYFSSVFATIRILLGVLELIKVPDSVFFITAFDFSFLPSNFPMLSLSQAPKLTSSDIAIHWGPMLNDEIIYYERFHSTKKFFHGLNLNSIWWNDIELNLDPDIDKNWVSRKNKAIHIGVLWGTPYSVARQVVLELALKFPTLIDASYSAAINTRLYYPHRTDSAKGYDTDSVEEKFKDFKSKLNLTITEVMSQYKFLVVLSGNSLSGRLATFLRHSGATILLQETDMIYPMLSKLKPWIHYVPLSLTASDLVDKIKFLIQNDNIARTIAHNGYIFGKSYLRIEDYYCHYASILHAFGNVQKEDDYVLKPFENGKYLQEIPQQ